MDTGRTGFDHALHQLECVEWTTEAGLCVSQDRQQIVPRRRAVGFGPLDLVGSAESVVQAGDDGRNRVGRIERLVGIDVSAQVGVGCHLPAREVDGRKAGLGVLDGLAAGHGTQRVYELHRVDAVPELGRALSGQRALGHDRSPQADDVLSAVVALDAIPARVLGPVALESGRLFGEGRVHDGLLGGSVWLEIWLENLAGDRARGGRKRSASGTRRTRLRELARGTVGRPRRSGRSSTAQHRARAGSSSTHRRSSPLRARG